MPRIDPIALPKPRTSGRTSVEEAISNRRSVRDYHRKPISLSQLAQVLWAAQGVTDAQSGHRAAPSPGAKYGLELYVFTRKGGVRGLPAGLYHYEPTAHGIALVRGGDYSSELQSAARDQEQIGRAAAIIAMTGVFDRVTPKYGERGIQYVLQESGSAGENVYIESTALGLGTVMMGAFDDSHVARLVGAKKGERPLLLMPLGAL